MIKNKVILFTAALSLVSSAAVFAIQGAKSENKAVAQENTKTVVKNVSTAKRSMRHIKRNYSRNHSIDARTAYLEREMSGLKAELRAMKKGQEYAKSSTSWNKLYGYGPAIVTSPIFGKPDYVGSDLLINLQSINEDLALLKLNQEIVKHYAANNIPMSDRPIVTFSGELEGQAMNHQGLNGPSSSDIDLTAAALDTVINANQWVTGVLRIEFDNTPPAEGARVRGSQLRVRKGYVTMGNLDKCPIYLSIGQMYVPFGSYAGGNWLISDPLTQTLGRSLERPIVLGFSKGGTYASVYAFEGDTYTGSEKAINSWGANLGYIFTRPTWSFDFGAGYIANIADSLGMLNNGLSGIDLFDDTGNRVEGFEGFSYSHKRLMDRVPAIDLHALLNHERFTVAVEYITPTTRFNSTDMTFNDDGAKPKALDFTGVYHFNLWNKPSYVSAGFGQTWEALGVNLPQYRYSAVIGTSFFKNTVQSIEYVHDVNYNNDAVATSTNNDGVVKYIFARKNSRNMLTASFRVYF